MAPIVGQQLHSHQTHHRSVTKTPHKPFKPRYASKNALRDRAKGKIELVDQQNSRRKSRHQQVLSKLDRRNQAKQKRLASRHAHLDAASVFAGKHGAPRIVAVVPLSDRVDGVQVVKSLAAGADVEIDVKVVKSSIAAEGRIRVEFERFKQRLQFVLGRADTISVLDTCRLADFVLFVISPEDVLLDEWAQELLKVVESQGVSNVLVAIQGLERIEVKRRPQALTTAKISLSRFFPDFGKVHSLDAWQDCLNVVRSMCSTIPKGINWREERSWMLVEDVMWSDDSKDITEESVAGEVIITGVVRGRRLRANRLIQLGDLGDYQIEKIVAAPLAVKRKERTDSMVVDEAGSEAILDRPSEDQDDLLHLAPEEICMNDADADNAAISMAASQRNGVMLDDHRYFPDEDELIAKPNRLPKGTSKYQAAWFLGDEDDSGSDIEELEANSEVENGDPRGDQRSEMVYEDEDIIIDEPITENAPSEYLAQSEMFLDPPPEDEAEAEAIKAHRAQRKGKSEAEEDAEFPDEIELPPNVLARERLARYRGLKNPKTSVWDTEEDQPYEPAEWRRLLEIRDYKAARNKVLNETLLSSDGVVPGTRVKVHIRNFPLSHLRKSHDKTRPLGMFQLLRHEHKQTAMNYSITLNSNVENPVQSKSELLVQCGPRRLVINPIFSIAGSTPNDVHKLIRYLQPSQSAVASFIGPLTWGAVPVLYFSREQFHTSTNASPEPYPALDHQAQNIEPVYPSSHSDLHLIGTGTALPPSTNRITAKRIVLTGHPYKIHKRLVTVRYMFFNAEDVNWFRALRLWTRRGRSGYIKESLGTHGYFKATFDGKMGMMDAVGMTLWKRVWPRVGMRWVPEMNTEVMKDTNRSGAIAAADGDVGHVHDGGTAMKDDGIGVSQTQMEVEV